MQDKKNGRLLFEILSTLVLKLMCVLMNRQRAGMDKDMPQFMPTVFDSTVAGTFIISEQWAAVVVCFVCFPLCSQVTCACNVQ